MFVFLFLLSDFTIARPGIWHWGHGASRLRLPMGSQRRWRSRVVLSNWHVRVTVAFVERETFESALMAGRHALEVLGFDRFRVRDMANIFRRHNISITEAMIPQFNDDDRLVSAAKIGRDEFAEQFANDRR